MSEFGGADGDVGGLHWYPIRPFISGLAMTLSEQVLSELMKQPNLVVDRILWGLWEVLNRGIDLTRLKKVSRL